jgi:hypothetical protein
VLRLKGELLVSHTAFPENHAGGSVNVQPKFDRARGSCLCLCLQSTLERLFMEEGHRPVSWPNNSVTPEQHRENVALETGDIHVESDGENHLA